MYSVSIIMPIYNNEKTLKRAIDSILNQSIYGFELILINDGSTDGSASICDEYAKKEPLLIEVIHQKHTSVGRAKNTGLQYATGRFVYFADPKDYYQNNFLLDNVRLAIEKKADLVVFGFSTVNKTIDSGLEKHLPSLPHTIDKEQFRQHFRNFHLYFPFVTFNKLYRRSFLMKHRIKFEPFPQENGTFFNMDVFKHLGQVAFNRHPYIRRHSLPKIEPKFHEENLLKRKLKQAEYLEEVFYLWKQEEEYIDLIRESYFNAYYCEMLNICAPNSLNTKKEQQEKIQLLLEEPKLKEILEHMENIQDKNPIKRAIFYAAQRGNSKRILDIIHRKMTFKSKRLTIANIFRKTLKRYNF